MCFPRLSGSKKSLLLAGFFCLLLPALIQAAAPAPPPPVSTPVVVTEPEPRPHADGYLVVDATGFFAYHGLTPEWLEAGKRVRYANRWVAVELEHDKREARFNGLRFFLGEPVTMVGEAVQLNHTDAAIFFTPLLRPAVATVTLPLRTVVIDAGHGGNDGGARNAALNLNEKTVNLTVALKLEQLLEGRGWRVVQTRRDDRFLSLARRAEIANAAGADLFLSIHFNAVANAPSVHGIETYFLTPAGQRSTSADRREVGDQIVQPGNRHDVWNAVFAYHAHRELLTRLGRADRGIKRQRFAVLRLVDSPAILVEGGYLTNEAEAQLISTDAYLAAVAEALANAISAYAASLAVARPLGS